MKLRRTRWEWNRRLLVVSTALLVLVVSAAYFSHQHFSAYTADEFLRQAKEASSNEKFNEQIEWLRRYSRMFPNDSETLVEIAHVSDKIVENSEGLKRRKALNSASRAISSAIGRLGSDDAESKAELQRMLIRRYLEIGGSWNREAELQIIELSPPDDDPLAHKQLGMALASQVRMGIYSTRTLSAGEGYWRSLSSQPPGDVIGKALELNQGDLDLLDSLVVLALDFPSRFTASNSQGEQGLYNLVETHLDRLKSNSSRGNLIRYQLESVRDLEAANLEIIKLAETTFARLDVSVAEAGDDFAWDYLLVGQAAQLVQDKDLALEYYDKLIGLETDRIRPGVLETIFLLSAGLRQNLGKEQEALQIFEKGLEKLGDNRLSLLSGYVNLKMSDPDVELDECRLLQTRFKNAIEEAALQLAKTSREFDVKTVDQRAREIAIARWRDRLIGANLESRIGNFDKAVSSYESAFATTTDIDDLERANAAIAIADLHESNGSFDLAGMAVEKAVQLFPNSLFLHRRAAQLWASAGDRERSLEHWRLVDQSDMNSQLELLDANTQYQLGLPKGIRDLTNVRTALKKLSDEVDGLADSSPSKEMKEYQQRLEFFEIILPPEGKSLREYRSSESTANQLVKLSDDNQNDQWIQTNVATMLAQSGHEKAAEEVLQRYLSSADLAPLEMVKAKSRMAAASGNLEEAATILSEFISNSSDDAIDADDRRLAAAYAEAGQNNRLAYLALANIPQGEQSHKDMFQLLMLAKELAAPVDVGSKKMGAEEAADYWMSELKKSEGTQKGSYWRLAEARDQLHQLRMKTAIVEQSELAATKQLANDLLLLRPRWGKAISLMGWIAALENLPDRAVEFLSNGIAAGDKSFETNILLWGQLFKLGREQDAMIQIAQFENQQAQEIESGRNSGLIRGLSLARSNAQSWPNDYLAQLVLARWSILVAENATSISQRDTLLSDAKTLIGTASELVGSQDSYPIYAAQLALNLASGNSSDRGAFLKSIEDGELSGYQRSILQAMGYFQFNDFASSLRHAIRADELKPSRKTKLLLAEIYQNRSQVDEQITYLRQALRIVPTDAVVKQQLAQAIVGRGRDVDWAEIESLLVGSSSASPRSQLLYVGILISRGTAEQKATAENQLKEWAEQEGVFGTDALRVYCSLLRSKVNSAMNLGNPKDALITESIQQHTALTESPLSNYNDLYTFADFLIQYADSSYLDKAANLIRQMDAENDATIYSLNANLNLAKKQNVSTEKRIEIAESWIDRASQTDTLTEDLVWLIAGKALALSGAEERGIKWIEKAYQRSPQFLVEYVLALGRSKQAQKAIDVCARHYMKDVSKPGAAVLMVETILAADQPRVSTPHRNLLNDAIQRHSKNTTLLEGMGTWKMQEGDFVGAVNLFNIVIQVCRSKNERVSPRTYNNLAMAYTQIPGSESQGLEPIKRALEESDNPELKDTLGAVLIGSGRFREAETVFRNLVKFSNEPRFRFHLVLSLYYQGKKARAKEQWQMLELKKININGLTKVEQDKLIELKEEFGTQSVSEEGKEIQ